MSNINNDVLQEMIMVAQSNNKINRFTTHNLTNQRLGVRDEPKIDWSEKLSPGREFKTENWQQKIIDNIHNRVDQFVNVSPAGGKSYPIQRGFWLPMVAKAKTIDQLPKVLWICENKTLASEVRNGFIEIILDILSKPPKDGSYIEHLVPPYLKFNTNVGNKQQFIPTNQNIGELRKFAQHLTSLKMQGSNETINQHTIAASCTYKYAPEFIKEMQPRIVVIDEIQERFKVTTGDHNQTISGLKDLDDRVEYLIKTFKTLPPPRICNVALLTGSMAHGTSKGIMDYLNHKYNRQFVPISTDSAFNRAAVSVIPYDHLTRNDGKRDDRAIIKEVTGHIRNDQKFNLVAIFSQVSIKRICNDIIKSTPKRSPEATVGARGNINTKYPGVQAQTQVGRDVIANLAKKMESDPQELLKHLKSMLKGEIVGGVRTDRDLANALLHGVGYIMAEGREGGKVTRAYNPLDVKLVEILLKSGKINTVLATTSVGVGVNLKIKNLYLPSTIIPSGGKLGAMDPSTLVQLLNRAGRKDNMAATVYCNTRDFERVIQYFGKGKYAGDPSQSVPVIPFSNMGGSLYGSDLKSRFNRSLNPTATMRLIIKMLG